MRSATEIADLIRSGELSALQSVRQAFDRIARLNPRVNAFIQLDQEAAEAGARDRRPRGTQ